MAHSNPDPNTGREILYKALSNFEDVCMLVKISNESTSVAKESQVYSTVHFDNEIRSSTTKNTPQSQHVTHV